MKNDPKRIGMGPNSTKFTVAPALELVRLAPGDMTGSTAVGASALGEAGSSAEHAASNIAPHDAAARTNIRHCIDAAHGSTLLAKDSRTYDAVVALSPCDINQGPHGDGLYRTLDLPDLRHRVRDFI
jgi:hypothetical protein